MAQQQQQISPRWVRNAEVAKYLNVTTMTVWRWSRNPDLGFPKPSVIKSIEYRDLNQLDDWMKSMIKDREARERRKVGHRLRRNAVA